MHMHHRYQAIVIYCFPLKSKVLLFMKLFNGMCSRVAWVRQKKLNVCRWHRALAVVWVGKTEETDRHANRRRTPDRCFILTVTDVDSVTTNYHKNVSYNEIDPLP